MMREDFDPDPQFVTIGGERYCYRKSGNGPPILLLHGLAETSKYFWRKLFPYFERQFEVIY